MSEGGFCDVCGKGRIYKPPGIGKTSGQPFNGSWRCPTRGCESKPKWIQGDDYQGGPASPDPQADSRPAGSPKGPMPTASITDRSIAAQAACKAACEAAAGVCAGGRPEDAQDFTVILARRLCAEVIWPAMGLPTQGIWHGPDNPRLSMNAPRDDYAGPTDDPDSDIPF